MGQNGYEDFSFSIGTGFSNWDIGNDDYDSGVINTINGIVSAYAQGDKEAFHSTQLRFVKNGRCHNRSWDKRYSRRGMAKLAREFSKEISKS